MSDGGSSPRHGRLIVVCRADEVGRYAWLPPRRAADTVVCLDGLAAAELAGRGAVSFDDLESWESRSAGELSVDALIGALRSSPAVGGFEIGGHRLIDFAEFRLRREVARALRGWTLARAVVGHSGGELVCDPAAPPALVMGLRAGMGLDPATVPYAVPPEVPGSRAARAAVRPLMRVLGGVSRPSRMRVAAVMAGKLTLALDAVPAADLRAVGLATMPFPGLDHGNSAVFSLRRGLPMLATFGSPASSPASVTLPERLDLGEEPELERVLTLLVERLLDGTAGELAGAVDALSRIERADGLRALLLPTAALGSARLLIAWAHRHGIRVGAIQHGIYAHREFDGGDRQADVIFGWGEATEEQVQAWPEPRPAVLPVGVPGLGAASDRRSSTTVRSALIATTNTIETPLAPTAFCKDFIDAIAPGLAGLAAAGVQLTLRPHPAEERGYYRRLLERHRLDIPVTNEAGIASALDSVDVVISSTSSLAFEAAALGAPVLLWIGPAPHWVRAAHLISPWVELAPGMFGTQEEFAALAEGLVKRPDEAIGVARELGGQLARYARPFDLGSFAEGLHMLAG